MIIMARRKLICVLKKQVFFWQIGLSLVKEKNQFLESREAEVISSKALLVSFSNKTGTKVF